MKKAVNVTAQKRTFGVWLYGYMVIWLYGYMVSLLYC